MLRLLQVLSNLYYYPENRIIIITGDTDYLQLVNKSTRVVKLPTLEDLPLEIKIGKNRIKVSPEEYLNVKILTGDKTDEIPAVYHGCGPRTALNMIKDPIMFKKNIEDIPEHKQSYEMNRKLISFDEIPVKIVNEIEESYKKVKNNMRRITLKKRK